MRDAGAGKVNILLDEPVSNSGRLKSCMAEIAEDYSFETDIRILRDVDRELYGRENVITSDSIILDHCASWINLTKECMRRKGSGCQCRDAPGNTDCFPCCLRPPVGLRPNPGWPVGSSFFARNCQV